MSRRTVGLIKALLPIPIAVGIAAHYTGIYPLASPGGWNLIGTAVDFVPFSPATGSVLALGDRVRFQAVP